MTSLVPPQERTAPLAVPIREDPAARAAFSRRIGEGREDGEGNVSLLVGAGPDWSASALRARARLAAAVGLGPDAVVYAEQVHGAGVALVGRADRGRGSQDPAAAIPGVDALVTTEAGIGLAVLAADCVPLLLAAPGRGVAAVHAGRRGFASGVVRAALDLLLEVSGIPPGRVVAIAGPAIGGCCYELPAEMVERMAAAVPACAATTTWGTPAIDVRAGVVAQLTEGGVGRIEEVGACTRCGDERWFSARRAAVSTLGDAGPPGRNAGIICRRGWTGPDDGGDRQRER